MKKSVVEILKDLVAFPSISKTANENIVAYLENFFRKLDFEVARIASTDEPKRYNLLCKIGPDIEDGLMLSGHMDVVPVAGQNWQSDPFILTRQEGKLIGRGAVDMKGFIAAVCQALTHFPLHRIKKPLILLWTYDEEVGCIGSAHAGPLLKNYMQHLPKSAWIGEPTGFNILRMHSGHVTVKISAKGKGAHSSDPDLGISAIQAINRALNGLFALENELKTEKSYQEFFKRPYVSMNIGQVHGGTAVNIVPDEAYAVLGFRPLPDSSIEAIHDRIVKACMKEQENPKAIIRTSIEKITPAMITKSGTKLETILQPLAHNQNCAGAQYSTDGGNLNLVGMESLIYGPGTIDVAHQANEWMGEKDLVLAVENIEKVLGQWFLL